MEVWKVIVQEPPLGWDEVSPFTYVQRTEAIFTTEKQAVAYALRQNASSEYWGHLEHSKVVRDILKD